MIALPVGRFGRSPLVRLPVAAPVALGSSMARVPFAVRFDVTSGSRAFAGVGGLVKADCFPALAPFVCRVVFGCGRGPSRRRGGYSDPWSPWFNVFFGGYQVDAARSDWDRPFGFRREGDELRPDVDELVQLGRADWDYFTAYPYGVPLEVIRELRRRSRPPSIPEVQRKAVFAGGRWWDLVTIDRVSVVSGYVSGRDGARLANAHRLWSPLWRGCFGLPTPREDHPESFPLVDMRARLLVSCDEHRGRFRTFVCGGTVSTGVPAASSSVLLDEQLAAVRPLLGAPGPQPLPPAATR
jgi:hypothetical protein